MISWRYHLVTIVAVFLALGIGVLAGTTVLDQGIVNNLRDRTERLQGDLGDLNASIAELRDELDTMNAFVDQAMPYVLGAALSGRQVVIVTQEGIEGGTVSGVRSALEAAGAEILTTLSVRAQMAAETPATQRTLADLLGLPVSSDPSQLAEDAAGRLATRLSTDPVGEPPADDFLGGLLEEGFVTASGPGLSDATLGAVGGRGQIVVTIGGTADLVPVPDTFLVPLVRGLVDRGVTTGAGEAAPPEDAGDTDGDFVQTVRSDLDAESSTLVTVDDADMPIGGVAMVLGLSQAVFTGTGGDYGLGPNASRLLPAPS